MILVEDDIVANKATMGVQPKYIERKVLHCTTSRMRDQCNELTRGMGMGTVGSPSVASMDTHAHQHMGLVLPFYFYSKWASWCHTHTQPAKLPFLLSRDRLSHHVHQDCLLCSYLMRAPIIIITYKFYFYNLR